MIFKVVTNDDLDTIQYQIITGCNPEGYQDPRLWVNEGGGVYSHMTGRGCTSTNFVGNAKLPLPN